MRPKAAMKLAGMESMRNRRVIEPAKYIPVKKKTAPKRRLLSIWVRARYVPKMPRGTTTPILLK